jgi:hypothetical protein
MKTVTIVSIGINKNDKPYIRGGYFEGNFKVVRYIECQTTDDYEVGQEIEVPAEALS